MQFSAERVVIAKFAVIRLRMCISCCPYILEIRLRQRRLILRQRASGSSAGAEEKNGDEGRQDGKG
jgi:hypothetical protein